MQKFVLCYWSLKPLKQLAKIQVSINHSNEKICSICRPYFKLKTIYMTTILYRNQTDIHCANAQAKNSRLTTQTTAKSPQLDSAVHVIEVSQKTIKHSSDTYRLSAHRQ